LAKLAANQAMTSRSPSQFLLGHVSVQTTEKYLGCKQRIGNAVNDRIGIEPSSWNRAICSTRANSRPFDQVRATCRNQRAAEFSFSTPSAAPLTYSFKFCEEVATGSLSKFIEADGHSGRIGGRLSTGWKISPY